MVDTIFWLSLQWNGSTHNLKFWLAFVESHNINDGSDIKECSSRVSDYKRYYWSFKRAYTTIWVVSIVFTERLFPVSIQATSHCLLGTLRC